MKRQTNWHQVISAASDLELIRRLSTNPLLRGCDVAAKRRFALAMDEAPPLRQPTDSPQGWATLGIFGITPENLSSILEALGASEVDIVEAMADPVMAYRLLKELGQQRKESQR